MVDKNQAIIDFLLQCPQLRSNPLFFNFTEAKDNNKQLLPLANDKLMNRTFIDGSVMKRYTFTLKQIYNLKEHYIQMKMLRNCLTYRE